MTRAPAVTVLLAALVVGVATSARSQGTKGPARSEPNAQAALRKETRIGEPDARKTALAAVPGGRVQSHELERENGKLIYSYDIKVAGKPGVEEVNVDAKTGTILTREHEDSKTEAREKKAEAKKKP